MAEIGSEPNGKSGGDPNDDRRGTGATISGVLVLVPLVAGGIWLVNEMAETARYSKCAAARHRNCDGIDYHSAPAPAELR
ncbi:MAG: hypothetical protein ACREIP_08225 [Alphaproteobacteria bacterium]